MISVMAYTCIYVLSFCLINNISAIRSFHSIHNVVDRSVLQPMWDELAGKVGHAP